MVTADLHPGLRDYVVSWCGFEEWTPGVTPPPAGARRLRPADHRFPAVVRRRRRRPRRRTGALRRFGFAAGMHDQFALTESKGLARAMQIDFTPIGAHLFFGRPMSDMTNLVVGLDDLFGADGVRLVDRLDRRARLGNALRHPRGVRPAPAAGRAGAVTGRELGVGGSCGARTGRSRSAASPRNWAAAASISSRSSTNRSAPRRKPSRASCASSTPCACSTAPAVTNPVSGADVAIACGYFDQAHFIKDFRQLAGITPTEYLRHRIPELTGLAAD